MVSPGWIKCSVQSKLKLRCSVSQKSVTSRGADGLQTDFVLHSLVRVLLVIQGRTCIGEFDPFLFQTSLQVIFYNTPTKTQAETSVTTFSGPCLQGFLAYCLKESNFLIRLSEEKDLKDSSNESFLSIMKIHPRSRLTLKGPCRGSVPDVKTVHVLQAPCEKLWTSESNADFFPLFLQLLCSRYWEHS